LAECQFKVNGWGILFICRINGTLVYWHIKTQIESGPVTVDLTTTVVHSYKLLINDINPDHSLNV